MNKRQKLVQKNFLDNEEAVLKRLEKVYKKALKDIMKKTKDLQDQINAVDAMISMTDDADENGKTFFSSPPLPFLKIQPEAGDNGC